MTEVSRAPGAEPLRILIAGAGPMGRHHARAIGRLEPGLADLVGFVDPDEGVRDEAGQEFGVPSFSALGDALSEVAPNVVHICSPPRFHAEDAILCLESGAHVYVEKPFALTSAEARDVLSTAERLGLHVAAGHQLLEHPASQVAERYLPFLGDLRHVDSYFSFKTRRETSGRRPRTPVEQLLDITPHPTYLLGYFMERCSGQAPEISWCDAGEEGWAHAAVKCGDATGSLVVTLEGRPVDSFVRLVGTRGTVTLDYVRGLAVASLGEGSTIDKIFDPYLRSMAIWWRSTKSLFLRFLKRERSFPGLRPMFEKFYRSIVEGGPGPVTSANILFTTDVLDQVGTRIRDKSAPYQAPTEPPSVIVTGGTGFLGREVARELLEIGEVPLVFARRLPPARNRLAGAHYEEVDLADPSSLHVPPSVHSVVHCAAETAGSWDAHERNSVQATRNLLQTAADAGAQRFVHVSSLAVVASDVRPPVTEESPIEADPRSRGPYVWGKLESERVVAEEGPRLGVSVRIVRPGPLVDDDYAPSPGRLGRALGPVLVAVGPSRGRIPTTSVGTAATVIARSLSRFDEMPAVLHLLDVDPPTRAELVAHARRSRKLVVVWLPWPVIRLGSLFLLGVQRALGRGERSIRIDSAFKAPRYDTAAMARVLPLLSNGDGGAPES